MRYRESIEEAWTLRDTKDAVFIVYEYYIYDGEIEAEEEMHGMFSSYDAALEFVRKDFTSKRDEVNMHH